MSPGFGVRRHRKLDWRRQEELAPFLNEGGPDGRVDGGPWRPRGGRSGRWNAGAGRGGGNDPAASAGLGIAKFPFVRTLEGFDFAAQPSLDPKQVRDLAACY